MTSQLKSPDQLSKIFLDLSYFSIPIYLRDITHECSSGLYIEYLYFLHFPKCVCIVNLLLITVHISQREVINLVSDLNPSPKTLIVVINNKPQNYYIFGLRINHKKFHYSWLLNKMGLNCVSLLINNFFFQ